jgi:hypothetical protein
MSQTLEHLSSLPKSKTPPSALELVSEASDLAAGAGIIGFVLAPFALPFLALLVLAVLLLAIPMLAGAVLAAPDPRGPQAAAIARAILIDG